MRPLPVAVAVAVAVALVVTALAVAGPAQAASGWPARGQAAYALGGGPVHATAHAREVPIASVAKVMTAYVVLQRRPIPEGAAGFTLNVTRADVSDWHRRVARGESTVPVRAGAKLTERQALAALLLPSANNVAIMLARRVSGSVAAFVKQMNRAASALGMRHTVYTDPSGFDAKTRSIPTDQLILARAALHSRFFRLMVNRTHLSIPVAGTIHNTDTLLRHDGFVGIKTGSMSASGGCFLFASRRLVHGRVVTMIGIVLGQRGGDLVQAGLSAARRLVDRVAPKAAG